MYSIKIVWNLALAKMKPDNDDPWAGFQLAVQNKDMKKILDYLRPDIEIYQGDSLFSVDIDFYTFSINPSAGFINTIIGKQQSVLSSIKNSKPVKDIRISENLGVGLVYKFPQNSDLKEIYFLPYNGKFKVFEISFRNAK